ncbi:hypothetical protein ACTFIY_009057 [Dictyostelium cf. discoideum]
MKTEEGSHKCTQEFCGMSYGYASSLSRHITKKHAGSVRNKSASKKPMVMCRHSDCTFLCHTKHRRRHEKGHKNLCQDQECPACTNPDQFKRGRKPKHLSATKNSIIPSRQLKYCSIQNLLN